MEIILVEDSYNSVFLQSLRYEDHNWGWPSECTADENVAFTLLFFWGKTYNKYSPELIENLDRNVAS